MSSGPSLDSTATSQLQNIEKELEAYLKKAKTDEKELFTIRDELQKLKKNKNIPDDVKMKLNQAIQSLQPMSGKVDQKHVEEAKDQIHEIVEANKTGM